MQLSFENCLIDLHRRELRCAGEIVHTRAKVFDILRYLIENRDRVVSRDELMTACWPGLTVSDTTLSTSVLGVRRAIGDDVAKPRFVKTLRGQGFRFIADVSQSEQIGGSSRRNETGSTEPAPLSIAVLPFANVNGDASLDYLSDGLAEDIAGALSRFKAFTVIAANSSLQFRDAGGDPRQIAAELQATYLMEGSVRCADNAFRATAKLIHAPTGRHVWSEVYNGTLDRVFDVQDDISRRIVTNIAPHIDLEEIRRAADSRSDDLDAERMAWRARALIDRARSEGNAKLYDEGMALAEAAAARNAQCRQAWWTVAFGNYARAFAQMGANPEPLLARAREAAERLRALDRNDHSAYMALGWVAYIEQDPERAKTFLEQAHVLNPNCTMTLMLLGVIDCAAGDPQTGYDHLGLAIRLSPRDTFLGFMLAAQAFTCFALERFAEGIELARRAIQREPHAPANHIILAACLAESGNLAEAGAAIRKQLEINETLLTLYRDGKRQPFKGRSISDRYASALQTATTAS